MFRFVRNPDPQKKPPYGSRIDPTHPLAQGLVGCWLFNEGGGKRAFDLVSGRVATLHNSPVYEYDGIVLNNVSSQYIEAPSFPMITNENSFSILIYADVYSIDTKASSLCSSKATEVDGWSFNAEQYNNTGKVGISCIGTAGYLSNIDTPVKERSLFAITKEGNSSTVDLYVNDQVDQLSIGAIDSTTEIDGLVIGASHYNNDYHDYLNGKVITVYIFSKKLDINAVKQLCAEPYSFILVPQYWYMVDFGPPPTGLVTIRLRGKSPGITIAAGKPGIDISGRVSETSFEKEA